MFIAGEMAYIIGPVIVWTLYIIMMAIGLCIGGRWSYMEDEKKYCGKCKHHGFDYLYDDWYCSNTKAPEFENYTRYYDVCQYYERKDNDSKRNTKRN